MQNMSALWKNEITSPARQVSGKVELYNGSTLTTTFYATTKLSNFKVERTPKNDMLFGYTISQRLTTNLIDKDNTVTINKGDKLKPYLGAGGEYANFCSFIVDDIKKDEVKGTIEVVGYDLMNEAAQHTLAEIEITYPAEIFDYATAIATFLGTTVDYDTVAGYYYSLIFSEEAKPNYDGTETLREVLEDIAEVTCSICYIDYNNKIVFKYLENNSIDNIEKSQYFSLEVGKPVYITKISATTELGDNLASGDESGYNQIIHNNPFLNHEEAPALIEHLLTISFAEYYPYKIKWRGNPALEIGDCVAVTTKDGSNINLLYLGETINYTGGMSVTSELTINAAPKVFTNPTNIGTAIKETYAKVDKVNKQINMVVSESEANKEAIAALQLNTDSINASVTSIEQATNDALEEISEDVSDIKTKVDATMTSADVTLAIQTEIAKGANKVTTSTGFTFDENGLTVNKSNSEMETTITEDGMRINRNDTEVLVANNVGVQAANLHATTYLIIGNNSRFEDFGNRTACFWIG